MDTKLKKTHKKLKVLIIAFVIVAISILTVGLYPIMEEEVYQLRKSTNKVDVVYNYSVDDYGFVSSSIDTMMYQWTEYLHENKLIAEEVYEYTQRSFLGGYIRMSNSGALYMGSLGDGSKTFSNTTAEDAAKLEELKDAIINDYDVRYELMGTYGISGYFILKLDDDGKVTENEVYTDLYDDLIFIENILYGLDSFPGNTEVVFFMTEDSYFIEEYTYEDYSGYISYEEAYFLIGAPVVIIAAMLIVALVALLLPFIKPLNTGNEKIFRIPAEISIFLMGALILGCMGMFTFMSYTNRDFLNYHFTEELSVLGYDITPGIIYVAMIVANVLCWILCFFVEYILVTVIRQLIAHPIKFIKERFIIINLAKRIFKWIKKLVKKIAAKITEIVKSLAVNKLLALVLLINMIVACVACTCWFVGIPIFIIYTVIAYILVYKKFLKASEQFEIIRDASHKMAEGNFDIHIEEDLGVFQPISDELVKVKDGFEKALIEEAKSRDMKTELITNVSHDLKTPLTAIITYVDLLKKEDITEEERQQYIATLDMKSQRLKVLIEDLFEVSKANSGNVQMNLMEVDVVDLLKQVRYELEDKIEESGIEFRWNLPEEKVILNLDGQKTYRIFANLINNIVKYSMTGSRAFVDVRNEAGKVVITFKNISAEEIKCDVDNLTERFVRGDASRNSEGSGLGLAIVKSFVELQKGKFEIDVDGDLFKAIIEWSK